MSCLCRMQYGALYHEVYCSGPVGEYENNPIGTSALVDLTVDLGDETPALTLLTREAS